MTYNTEFLNYRLYSYILVNNKRFYKAPNCNLLPFENEILISKVNL